MSWRTLKLIAFGFLFVAFVWNVTHRHQPADHVSDLFVILGVVGSLIFLAVQFAEIRERYK